MFIKHIRGNNWKPPYNGEFLFECKSYQIQPMDESKFLMHLDHNVSFEVSKDGDQLYIMNENGRTIDSHDWSDVKSAGVNFN